MKIESLKDKFYMPNLKNFRMTSLKTDKSFAISDEGTILFYQQRSNDYFMILRSKDLCEINRSNWNKIVKFQKMVFITRPNENTMCMNRIFSDYDAVMEYYSNHIPQISDAFAKEGYINTLEVLDFEKDEIEKYPYIYVIH